MSTRAASGTASEAATAALARVPATKSAAAAAVNGDRRPTNLGLAVVGAEHDIPSPRASFGSSRRLQSLSSQRSSPAHEATRRKSPDPSTRPAIDGGVGGTIYARNPSGGSGGGGGAAASEDTADEDKDKRRSSRLWKIIWDAGRGGVNGGEDPKANREAMEKAVAAGRGHVRKAVTFLLDLYMYIYTPEYIYIYVCIYISISIPVYFGGGLGLEGVWFWYRSVGARYTVHGKDPDDFTPGLSAS